MCGGYSSSGNKLHAQGRQASSCFQSVLKLAIASLSGGEQGKLRAVLPSSAKQQYRHVHCVAHFVRSRAVKNVAVYAWLSRAAAGHQFREGVVEHDRDDGNRAKAVDVCTVSSPGV